ncbi:MAG: hypothetical protein JKY52_08390 [Flavobacteriales bacterium]|nr:hypothetical protein [Flavobacteriales bacterium]
MIVIDTWWKVYLLFLVVFWYTSFIGRVIDIVFNKSRGTKKIGATKFSLLTWMPILLGAAWPLIPMVLIAGFFKKTKEESYD